MGIPLKQLDSLYDPTPADQIKTRQGPGGRNLSYVDARYIMDRLDQLGPENWQRDQRAIGDRVACGIGLNIEGLGWVWKWDGAGETDIEGDKGAFSDSFKRAAVNWGLARDLYGSSTAGQRGTSSPAPRPAAQQAVGVSPAPTANEPPWPEETAGRTSIAPAGREPVDGGGNCPIHHKPYRNNARGLFCPNKLDDGSWCNEPRRAA